MFYQFMKWYLGWMAKLYFHRVYSWGAEGIPDGQPAIFASNHPAGFIEPILFTTNVRQPIHFLVLGSYLQSPWFQWLFKRLKMVPIFRSDITGIQTVEKNKSTFEYVYTALQENAHILIYPEARTHFIYKVRPLKKGIARMVRGFLARGTHDRMYVVPVGVNFVYPTRFRSVVFLHIGEPIPFDSIDGEETRWHLDLLQKTSEGMKKVVYNVEEESRHAVIQQLIEIRHNDLMEKERIFTRRFLKNAAIVPEMRNYVSRLDALDAEGFDRLRPLVEKYFRLLKAAKLEDRTVAQRLDLTWWHSILLIIGLPLALIGLGLNGFSLAASYLIKRNMVKRTEYKSAVAGSVSAVLTLVLFLLFLVLGIFWHHWMIGLAFLIPLSFYLLIFYLDLGVKLLQQLRWMMTPGKVKKELRNSRTGITGFLVN